MSTESQQRPKKSRYGPHGVGDPDDTSLRKMEITLLIPQIQRKIVNEEKCPKEIEEYLQCVSKAGLILGCIKCRTSKRALSDCLEYWNSDEEMFCRARKLYLEERSEYRRTGVCKEDREVVYKYLEEKQKGDVGEH